jgi:hypothetical protein
LLITVTGWSWEYIDEHMTLPRLAQLSAYWQNQPPTHMTSAIMAGIKPRERSAEGMTAKVPDFAELPEIEEGAQDE